VVVWVDNDVWELFAHLRLRKFKEAVELSPELVFERFGRGEIEVDIAKSKSLEDAEGCLITFVSFQVSELSLLGQEVDSDT